MPELPEVECLQRSLVSQLIGRRINFINIRLDKIARPNSYILSQGLKGRRVITSRRHGKLLILGLDNGSFWTIHLGMTGQLIVSKRCCNTLRHLHIIVNFVDLGPILYFYDIRQFGNMGFWLNNIELTGIGGPLGRLGPDILGLSNSIFISRLVDQRLPIKVLLLNQSIIAGVGNIYADEALYRSGISPLVRPFEISINLLRYLNQNLQKILNEAINHSGSSISNFLDIHGHLGMFQYIHRIYRRAGLLCFGCHTPIRRLVLGGRSTHFCFKCQ